MVSLPAGKSFDACHTVLLHFLLLSAVTVQIKASFLKKKILNVYFTRARVKMLKSALASHYVH